jgi:hypothetical protein
MTTLRTDGGAAAWSEVLEEEDWTFLKRFLMSSGSLKALAESYGVSYPTLRVRLDRLISKVRAAEGAANLDPLERQLRVLLAEGAIAPGVARRLLKAHRESIEKGAKT